MVVPLAHPHPSDLPSHVAGYQPPADATKDPAAVAHKWLQTFAQAAAQGDGDTYQSLFVSNGYWRDILAFTNDIRAIRTANIGKAASTRFPQVKARDFAFADTSPAIGHPFPDVTFLTIHFTFATKIGAGYGVAHLVWDHDAWRAFTCMTMLESVKGLEPKVGPNRIRGSHNDRVSYDERRLAEAEYETRQPDVLIVGGGHNGLAAAAQLKSMGLDALVVDKYKRVGDNWRLRYRSLSLHDPVHANHLPFLPFPKTWPLFTPAGKLANFLEAYVEILELNVWTETTIDPSESHFDHQRQSWNVKLLRSFPDGHTTTYRFSVSHIILATGLGGGQPKMPAPFPGQAQWDGTAVHSSRHATGADWRGKRALVVGACTSGHDIAVDFAKNGVDVTMLQRTPTFVMSVDKGQQMMVSGLYNDEVTNIDLQDRIGESNPKFVVKLFHKRIITELKKADADLLGGLADKGFMTWSGPDDSGFIMMALEKAGGYYYSTGGSEAIIAGDIKVKQGEIASFEAGHAVRFKDGTTEQFDVVVFATGYTGFPDMVRETVGEHYAQVFKPVWGLDAEGEIRGVARESGIPNLFFLVGALAGSRVNSKVTALQIAAQRQGVFGERYTWEKQKGAGQLVDDKVYKAYENLHQHPTPVRDAE